MTPKKICLTGIKPTGTPHLGNYFAVIKPGLVLSRKYHTFFFIADYHALNTVQEAAALKKKIYEVTATWLACGLSPEESVFYRQSSVPEIMEISLILSCFTAKGLMNRAHAYKAAVAENEARGSEPDRGVNMGLFNYPILMAADILTFDANFVPIGKDQAQHLEITNDIAEAFHRCYQVSAFTFPQPLFPQSAALVPGIDGRKMSKSYHNTIPLFAEEKELEKRVKRIVTTSQTVADRKDPEQCNIFALYKLVAAPTDQEILAAHYRKGGLAWGKAKEALFAQLKKTFAPLREHYHSLIKDTTYLDRVLAEGAEKARAVARRKLRTLREIIGIG